MADPSSEHERDAADLLLRAHAAASPSDADRARIRARLSSAVAIGVAGTAGAVATRRPRQSSALRQSGTLRTCRRRRRIRGRVEVRARQEHVHIRASGTFEWRRAVRRPRDNQHPRGCSLRYARRSGADSGVFGCSSPRSTLAGCDGSNDAGPHQRADTSCDAQQPLGAAGVGTSCDGQCRAYGRERECERDDAHGLKRGARP